MEIQWPLLVFSVLLGITSGSFVFLGIGEIKGKFAEIRFTGALIGLLCLAVGGIASVFHMGHPERATHLLGNLGSGLSMELFTVAIMGIVSIIYLVLAKKDYPGARKAFGIIAAILGLVLPIVAGMSYVIAARPAWNSFTLPLMYLGAGLAMGMLLMAGLVLLRGNAKEDGKFAAQLALVGVVAMVLTSLAYIIWIAFAPFPASSRSIERLVSGDIAPLFWVGVVAIGLVVPTALSALAFVKTGKDSVSAASFSTLGAYVFAACACSVVGAVALRVIMYGVGTSVEQFIYH